MSLLVSWMHSGNSVRERLFNSSNLSLWLKRLVLEDPEPAVRREVCTALYRLCLCTTGCADSSDTSFSLVTPMLTKLLEFLSIAESMGPQKYEVIFFIKQRKKIIRLSVHSSERQRKREKDGDSNYNYYYLKSIV